MTGDRKPPWPRWLWVAALIAVGGLVSLVTSAQLYWPFAWRPSLITINEDADFRREVIGAVGALGGGVLLVALGVAFRRVRWLAFAGFAAIAWFAMPHLGLLLLPAYPTSFYHSPTSFSAASIVQGALLYPSRCASCHGADGRGDGPLAAGLTDKPADLTATHLWGHEDGELFWWLSHGMTGPDGKPAMPGFATDLGATQRWALIDYIRAHNAGTVDGPDTWPLPVRAPGFVTRCADRDLPLTAFAGKLVRLWFDDAAGTAPPALPEDAGVETVTIRVPAETAAAAGCVTRDPSVRPAYAILSGSTPDALVGTQFLIDPRGWLRAMRPGAARLGVATRDWADPTTILAEIRDICSHPISQTGSSHAHIIDPTP